MNLLSGVEAIVRVCRKLINHCAMSKRMREMEKSHIERGKKIISGRRGRKGFNDN